MFPSDPSTPSPLRPLTRSLLGFLAGYAAALATSLIIVAVLGSNREGQSHLGTVPAFLVWLVVFLGAFLPRTVKRAAWLLGGLALLSLLVSWPLIRI